jgi:hypothetical protein
MIKPSDLLNRVATPTQPEPPSDVPAPEPAGDGVPMATTSSSPSGGDGVGAVPAGASSSSASSSSAAPPTSSCAAEVPAAADAADQPVDGLADKMDTRKSASQASAKAIASSLKKARRLFMRGHVAKPISMHRPSGDRNPVIRSVEQMLADAPRASHSCRTSGHANVHNMGLADNHVMAEKRANCNSLLLGCCAPSACGHSSYGKHSLGNSCVLMVEPTYVILKPQ